MNGFEDELEDLGISIPKTHIINFEKIKTLDDVIKILRLMNLEISWVGECPEEFQELYNTGYLINITEFKQK